MPDKNSGGVSRNIWQFCGNKKFLFLSFNISRGKPSDDPRNHVWGTLHYAFGNGFAESPL